MSLFKASTGLSEKFNRLLERADWFLFKLRGTKNRFNKASQQTSSNFFNRLAGNIALRTGWSQKKTKSALLWTTMLTGGAGVGIQIPAAYHNMMGPEFIETARLWSHELTGSDHNQRRELFTDEGYFNMVPNQKGTADLSQYSVYMLRTGEAHFQWTWPFFNRDVEKISKYQFVDIPLPPETIEMYARDKKLRESLETGDFGIPADFVFDSESFKFENFSDRMKSFSTIVDVAGPQYSVDTRYMMSQLYQESRARRDAIGPMTKYGKAKGAWQFIDDTAGEFGIDPFDPVQSTFASAAYTRQLLDMFGGDYVKACAAYNCGPNGVQRRLNKYGDRWKENLPSETQNYIREIFGRLGGVPVDVKWNPSAVVPAVNKAQSNTALSFKPV